MKKILKILKHIYTPPRIDQAEPQLRGRSFIPDSDLIYDEHEESYEDYRRRVRERTEEHNRDNEIEIQIANFYVQRQALQKTLNIAYGSLVTSTVAILVALLAVVVTLIGIFHHSH